MDKKLKVLLTLLCIVFALIFAVSGYKIVSVLGEYKAAKDTYNKVSEQYVSMDAPKEKPEKKEETEEEVLEVSPISVDFAAMTAENSDVRGWLYSPDTVINYPLAQCEDNFFYLDHLINREWNPSGTLFLDCLNEKDFSSRNTLIYGHNMNDGSMFHSVRKYDKQEYYDAHPVMYLNTPGQNYKVEIFSGYITDCESDAYTISTPDDESFKVFLDKIKGQSAFKNDVELSGQDKIITLSTCTYEYDDARFVLHGKLVPIG